MRNREREIERERERERERGRVIRGFCEKKKKLHSVKNILISITHKEDTSSMT